MDLLSAGAAIAVAAVLICAAISKLRDVPAFGTQVAAYRLLPVALAPAVGAAIIACEFIVGASLLVPSTRNAAGYAALALAVAFTVASALTLMRGHVVPCACFGSGSSPIGAASLVRTVTLAMLAVIAVDGEPVRATLQPAAWLLGLMICAAWALLYSVVYLLTDLHGRTLELVAELHL